MLSETDDRRDAPTLDYPAKRSLLDVRCVRARCPYHHLQASDDDVASLRLLCRDGAPYLLRARMCVCLACLHGYAMGCDLLALCLIEAVERLTEYPSHIVEHHEYPMGRCTYILLEGLDGAPKYYPRA